VASGSPGPLPAPTPAPPIGLVSVSDYAADGEAGFASPVLDNPAIAGVALQIGWSAIEPSLGQFHWQVLDDLFKAAQGSGKFVALIIFPGFESPAWATQGTASASFAKQYGPGAGQSAQLPLPWDQTYLSRWFSMLTALAGRYAALPAFRMIAAAGPTSVSAEMSLPDQGGDAQRWTALGYTPSRYESSWAAVFQTYARLFPDQYVSLSLYPGLPIGERGRSDPAERLATPEAIISEERQYEPHPVVQTSGLSAANTGSGLYGIVKSLSPSVVTGFQLTTSATAHPDQMGDATDPVRALSLSLTRGTAADVKSLEVYLKDVLNPAMQPALTEAASLLKAGRGSS
jgi:hypothetical protein